MEAAGQAAIAGTAVGGSSDGDAGDGMPLMRLIPKQEIGASMTSSRSRMVLTTGKPRLS